jgi:predicted transcriptional regulator
MTVKLSPPKITRLLKMYLLGFPQLTIAAKLGINQSSVSLYINDFSVMVEEEGLGAVAKEFGIMDIVKELHSLGAELKSANSTIEDAKRGLKVAVVLDECGVPEAKYKDVVVTCLKMKQEGFQSAAMELHELEEESGLSYGEIVS